MFTETEPSVIQYVRKKINAFNAGIQTQIAALQALIDALTAQVNALIPNTSAVGLVAGIVQTQAGGTAITKSNSWFDTVANAGDSGRIDVPATVNQKATISNWGANDMKVFPGVGNNFNINGTPSAANASFTLASGNELSVFCAVAGEWRTQ